MNKDELLIEKERLKKILEESKEEYNKKKEEESIRQEIKAIKNAISIKNNQIKGKNANQWELRGKAFSQYVIKNPVRSLFFFGSFVFLIQGEWFAMIGSLVMALIIPEYMKWQKQRAEEKKKSDKDVQPRS